MSNVIPILSSSPPPIDDQPSFDDAWESNNYGRFQDAGTLEGSTSFHPTQPASCAKPDHKLANNNGVMNDSPDDEWADFTGPMAPPPVVDGEFVEAFSIDDRKTGSSASMNVKDVSLNDNLPPTDLPSHMGLQLRSTIDRTVAHGDGRKSPRSSSSSTGSQEERNNSCGEDFTARIHEPKFPKTDTQDNTSQDSVTDSGLCSDISPVPKFEEYPDFGDNKSSEVEFSDECQNKVGTILEQDEGFANFGTRDSCGTGSDNQSPDRDSPDRTQAFNAERHSYPEPLDFRPGLTFKEDNAEQPSVGPLNCSSGEGACTDLDTDAVTPTQAQYDAESLESLNSSPNPKQISPDQNNVSENVNADLSSESFNADQPANTATDIDRSCEPFELSQAKCAEPHESMDNFSDFQSTGSVTNSSCYPSEGDPQVCTTTQNSCVSSMIQPVATNTTRSSESGPASPAAESSHSPKVAVESSSESEDEWDFKDAVGDEGNADTTTLTQRQSPPPVQKIAHGGNDDSESEDEFGTFGEFASESTVDAAQTVQAGDDNDDDDDDDDDGWAFQGTMSATKGSDDDDDDDDDFGDFGDFSSTTAQTGFADFGGSKQTDNDDGGDDNNWASFAAPDVVLLDDEDEGEDDEFGNFGDAAPLPGVGTETNTTQQSSDSTHHRSAQEMMKMEPVDEVVARSFSLPEEPTELPDVSLLYTHMTRQTLREQEPPTKQTGRHANIKSITTDMSVWNNLRDLEKTAALRYTWDKSTTNNCLLYALAIDTRNILIGHKKPSVPIFAANLGSGVLEPSRGLPEVGREGRVSNVVNIPHVPSNIKLTAGTPQDIPPAEFDWSSAGLTNPLDSLENELLKSIEPLESKQPKTLEPLENYLANLKVVPTAPPNITGENDADHLTEAAYDIVTHLPPINFMHAKMLMFPVKGTASD